MRIMYLFLGLAAIAFLFAGPASAQQPPPQPDLNHADFGPYPQHYEALIKAWAEVNLKDPYSAKYVHISIPRKEWVIANQQPAYGWSVCAAINAKNSYGAYNGVETYWFFFRDGKIIRNQDIDKPVVIPGVISVPGNRISVGHNVNCTDGAISQAMH